VSDKARWCSENLYTPYERQVPGGKIAVVFRDHVLSDLIGFSYSRVSAEEAATDFVRRLHELDSRIQADARPEQPPLVSIILDGKTPGNTTEQRARLPARPVPQALRRPGDPDHHDPGVHRRVLQQTTRTPVFGVVDQSQLCHLDWPSGRQQGWDFLKDARDLVEYSLVNEHHKAAEIEKAYEEIQIAEGSDWFWWFGDDHSRRTILNSTASSASTSPTCITSWKNLSGRPAASHQGARAAALIYRIPRGSCPPPRRRGY